MSSAGSGKGTGDAGLKGNDAAKTRTGLLAALNKCAASLTVMLNGGVSLTKSMASVFPPASIFRLSPTHLLNHLIN